LDALRIDTIEPRVVRGAVSEIFEEVRLAASVFENSPDAIVITDAQNRIVRVNRAFTEITGYSPDEVVGRTPRLLKSGRHGPEFYAAMWRSIGLTGQWRGEIWNRRRSGEIYPEWLSITTVKQADGSVAQHVGTFSDLTEKKRVEEERARLALHDPLTGLVNRAFFEENLRRAIARALDAQRKVALVLLDLDRFGKVNAALGYETGDAVLAAVAERVGERVGEKAVVGRWYGDEFAVLLPLDDRPDEREAGTAVATVLEDVRTALALPISVRGSSLHVQACFGVAVCPRDARDVSGLLFSAETALRQAKARGPDTFCFHTPGMDAEVREHMRLEEEIRAAIGGRQIQLHYQPLVDVDSGGVPGAEALLRWRNPRTGDVPPPVLVSVAERSGVIGTLGRLTLQGACEDLARWRRDGVPLRRVAVNVSSQQLLGADFVPSVREALAAFRLDGRDLELEITEAMLVDPGGSIPGLLSEIRDLGVRVSVDDFGTGFSALSYLKHLPVDTLKIDRSFVSGLPADQSDVAITRTILALAANLGLGTVAEGVESLAQARFLALHGCRELQGNLYGSAVPAAELPDLVRRLSG
jgi:diguanylate cyclase (GGDEF)-like protein/PAS domain S-box-containing protein